ncbi:hypothetical protein HQ576_20020, partial [bacterium]|nr:hypothetical protein [bacterium]
VRQILLADADRDAVAAIANLPAEAQNGPTRVEAQHLASSPSSRAPSDEALTIHFADTFEQALELVFGAELLQSYRRALRRKRLRRPAVIACVVLAASLVGLLAWAMMGRSGVPIAVEIVANQGIQAMDGAGSVAWRKEFRTGVASAKMMRGADGAQRVVVGLESDGPLAGNVMMLDADGDELWRFHPGRASPFTEDRRLLYAVRDLLITDVLPHPGTEIIVCWVSQWSPSLACILSEDGQRLREIWHEGDIGHVRRYRDTNKLIFWGCNNAFRRTALDDGSKEIYYSFFCIEADKLGGQAPPYTAPGVPRAPILWYKSIKPQGVSYQRVTDKVVFGPTEAALEVWTTNGWVLYLDAEGNIIHGEAGERAASEPPTLIDGLAPFADRQPPTPRPSDGSQQPSSQPKP